MKKILLAILLLAAMHSVSMAQSSAYSSDDNLLNLGIGVGTPFFGSGYSASIPVNPTISYEKGITDAISVGAAASYARSSYSFSGFDSSAPYTIKETAIYVGARASYHLGGLLDLGSDVDLYGGISAGYVIVNVSDNQGGFAATASGAGYGLFAGGKYFFAPSVGVYAQIGYESLSYLNVGVAFKF